jgi:hypothetical protein
MTTFADAFIWALLFIGWLAGFATHMLWRMVKDYGHEVKEAFKDEHGGDY